MNLPRDAVQCFMDYMTGAYGLKWIPSRMPGEMNRTMFEGRLMVLRKHSWESQVIDVFFSDKNRLKVIEDEFWTLVAAEKEEENEQSEQ